MVLSALHIYPVKSLAGIEMQAARVEVRGLQYDRRWMLIDRDNRFVSQRENAQMALLGTEIKGGYLRIFDKKAPDNGVNVDLSPQYSHSTLSLQATIWDNTCLAWSNYPMADQWLSARLSMDVRLVYMPDESDRPADPKYVSEPGQQVSFADGYPFLLIGTASLADLNQRLAAPVPMNRFRPNFVVEGMPAYEEDQWAKFQIGTQLFRGVKPCARCTITTIDQENALLSKEPLRTLSTYRRVGNKVLFGQNVIWLGEDAAAWVRVGDQVQLVN